jgi:hypothetical protein
MREEERGKDEFVISNLRQYSVKKTAWSTVQFGVMEIGAIKGGEKRIAPKPRCIHYSMAPERRFRESG